MRSNRILEASALLLLTGSLAFGVAACGSSDSDPDDGGTRTSEITPEEKAPESAKDKGKKAPDDVISERPGGPAKPVSP